MNKKIAFTLSLLLPFSLASAMDVPLHLARAQKEADIENGLYTPLISQSNRQNFYAATYQSSARPTISYVPEEFRGIVRDKSNILSVIPRELLEDIFKFVQYKIDPEKISQVLLAYKNVSCFDIPHEEFTKNNLFFHMGFKKFITDNHEDINTLNEYLYKAVKTNDSAVVTILLQNGANGCERQPQFIHSPLSYAAADNNNQMLWLLLSFETKLDKYKREVERSLFFAHENHNSHAIEILKAGHTDSKYADELATKVKKAHLYKTGLILCTALVLTLTAFIPTIIFLSLQH